MNTLLHASAITFQRQGEPVFEPVNLALCGGQALVIQGPNGCGKTTLLRVLAGILDPACGTIARHAPIAFLGHLPAVKGELTVRENLDFLRRFHGADGIATDPALARSGLAGLGLRPARTLSAGQKRRLGLAGLLVSHRPVWLLDEPYASLDTAGANLVDRLLDEHLAGGGTVVMSTHQRLPDISAATSQLQMNPSPLAARP